MRINKYLADKKIATRRGADELIKEKKVFVNGKLAELGTQVSDTDKVEVKGAKAKEYKYFAYNKPVGIETASPREGLFPMGRLDKNSHGLLILTNDGRITEQLLSPKYFHEKEYVVRTLNKLRSSFKNKMEAGVNIEGYQTKKCTVKVINENNFRVILTEGKKHQIRRMCSALFQEIADLKRERIMNIKLGKLPQNSMREIKGEELAIFLKSLAVSN
jgi:23S rRNA pseudouridine2604 synthase